MNCNQGFIVFAMYTRKDYLKQSIIEQLNNLYDDVYLQYTVKSEVQQVLQSFPNITTENVDQTLSKVEELVQCIKHFLLTRPLVTRRDS